jgi:hypothetical protein
LHVLTAQPTKQLVDNMNYTYLTKFNIVISQLAILVWLPVVLLGRSDDILVLHKDPNIGEQLTQPRVAEVDKIPTPLRNWLLGHSPTQRHIIS